MIYICVLLLLDAVCPLSGLMANGERYYAIIRNEINKNKVSASILPYPTHPTGQGCVVPSFTCHRPSHDSTQYAISPVRSFFPFTTCSILSTVPKGYFFSSSPSPSHSLKRAMSYRTDNGASYDRTLLSSVPDPTRAEKQVRVPNQPSIPFSKPAS